jgi:hypothetical protein
VAASCGRLGKLPNWGEYMLRLFAVLALAVALALPWVAPTPVQAGGGGGVCPPNYGLTTVDSYQNHPLRRSAARADKDDDGYVCFKFGGPGPQLVDDNGFEPYPN